MKKKGLIISTIVMVVVLIASLTTATYAWFNANAEVKVNQITLSTSAADGLLIGVHKTNSSTSSSPFQDYVNGSRLTFGKQGEEHYAGTWSGYDTTGFGTQVSFQSLTSLNAQYGVQYTTDALNYVDAEDSNNNKTVAANNWFKASGTSAARNSIDLSTIDYAEANGDFIVLDLGCTPSVNNKVKQAWVDIVVTLSGTSTIESPGMAAALNFAYAVNNATALGKTSLSSLTQVDAFSGMTQDNGYAQASLDAGVLADNSAASEGDTWTYSIELYNNATAMTKNATISRIYLIMFLDGDDDACILSNLGTGCTIDINFGWSDTQSKYTFSATGVRTLTA